MNRTPLKTKHSCALSAANKLFFFAAMLVSIATVAQPRTFVKSVSVNYATKQVTFNLSWAAGSRGAYNGKVYYSKVWVWVDYQTVTDPNSKGAWQRATVDLSALPAGCTADGTNAKGFWYQGQATAAQNANITVTLTNMPAKFNWCAYASDCPPRIVGNSGGTYTFAGTPPFILIAANGATQEVAGKTIAASSLTIVPVKITDKTEYPGVWCPYTGSDLFVDATHACIMRPSGAQNGEAYIKDSRDGKYYRIVQMPDNKWWLAQNLDYRKGLTFRQASNSPSTVTGSNTALIGSYWCPAGSGASVTTSTANAKGCDNWGALYSWETVMLYNGLGSWNETLNNAYTSETSAPQDANMRINYGRKSGNAAIGGPGICPAGWHVPTEYEWAILLDKVAGSGTTFVAQNYLEWAGEDNSSGVGAKLKAAEYCASGNCVSDDNVMWNYHAKMTEASDLYGFRGLPAGYRYHNGSDLRLRGNYVFYWSSSVYSATYAWRRYFSSSRSDAYRYYYNRACGFSVRCVRD